MKMLNRKPYSDPRISRVVKMIVEDTSLPTFEKKLQLKRLEDGIRDGIDKQYVHDVALSIDRFGLTEADRELLKTHIDVYNSVIEKQNALRMEVAKITGAISLRKSYGVNWTPTFDATVAIYKAQDGFKYLSGYISDGSIDRDGDRMTRAALKGMEDTINRSGMNLFSDHEHGWKNILGAFTRAKLDSKGLWAEVRLEDETKNAEVASLLNKLASGIKLGLSIGGDMDGFENVKEYDEKTGRYRSVRNIKGVKLYEVSVVGLPANSNATTLNVR